MPHSDKYRHLRRFTLFAIYSATMLVYGALLPDFYKFNIAFGIFTLLVLVLAILYEKNHKSAITVLEDQITALKEETWNNEHAQNLITDNMLNGFKYARLIYENGKPVDFIFLKVNASFEKITGLKNVVGKKLSEVADIKDEFVQDRLMMFAKVASSGVATRVKTYEKQREKWFNLSILSAKADHVFVIFEEVADRPVIGKNSVLSTEQQHAFTQYSPVNIAMLDLGMNYIACSEKWRKENGRGHEDLIGRNHFDVNPDLPAEWKDYLDQAINGIAINNVELMWQQNDGNLRWMRASVQPWRFENNEIGGLIICNEEITEHKLTESDLFSVLEESGDSIWICDVDGHFIYANSTASKLTGYSSVEMANIGLANIIREEYDDELMEYLALTKYTKFTRRDWTINHKDGSPIHSELTTGHLVGGRIIILGRDLTEKLETEEERFKLFQAVEQSPGFILITDLNGNIEYSNTAFLKRTGYSRKEIIGHNPRIIKSGKTSATVFVNLWKTLKQGDTWQGEITNVSKNGQEFVQFTTISPIRQSNGSISHYVAIGEDISERKKGEERIFELAYFDALTGLPNKTLLLDRLNQVISSSVRNGVFNALLFIDLDHFKNINDTLGHQKGDEVLALVAERLMISVRDGDTVSRFGGDEFIVLLASLGTDSEAAANRAKSTALKLLESLNQTFQLGEVVHHSSASIGVAMFGGAPCTPDELLKQADLAMYKSKKAGRNTLRFFDPSLEFAMKQHATMEIDLRKAIQDDQFILHYQGQFTDKGELTGAEVLLRWKHPVNGMMSPALFIPYAEETGLIIPIGNWVLETACTQLAIWEKIPGKDTLTLAVNVSALQFRQPDFINTVLKIIQRTGINPQRLKLELTESMLIENLEEIIEKMLVLKKHGVGFSLDDFGTGYSSLSFLKRLPLDQLKIDQSFIRDVHSDPNGASIAKTIVSLGKNLGLNVIAEGVESSEQREFLANAGCYAYQGYLFSRPLSIEEFDALCLKMLAEKVS